MIFGGVGVDCELRYRDSGETEDFRLWPEYLGDGSWIVTKEMVEKQELSF